jgi:mono/diheme cytochrome c family protein
VGLVRSPTRFAARRFRRPPFAMRRLLPWILVVVVLAAAVTAVYSIRPQIPSAERGRRLAERAGCFGCHGAGGIRGASNPGRKDRSVPTFEGDLMMYAKSRGEISEWIRDGVTTVRSRSETWRKQRDLGTLRMPAYGKELSPRQIDDLVAFVLATAGEPEVEDSLAAYGLVRADSLGCTGCHGPGGRLARPNPGSLKGYIPSWDGADFPELVRDRAEFHEWVDHGISVRFERNPIARYFLRRAAVVMPAYERHLAPGDVDALWSYVQWLRTEGVGAPAANTGATRE